MVGREFGSLTKELPLINLDNTITAIEPGQSYSSLLEYAKAHTQSAAPGLISKRFILVRRDEIISYDHFLSLVATYGINSALVRKVMFFVWAFRDERLRRFICERVADRKGKWRVTQLTNKDNANFFEEWLQPGPSRKARSNIEFFLVETGIFDKSANKIDLGLEDGWLLEAAAVAAQHEGDPRIRRQLAEEPGRFLVENGWMALANATEAELNAIGRIPLDDAPREDDALEVEKNRSSSTKEWNRKKPNPSDKKSITAMIDVVARERANLSHHQLEEITAEAIRARGFRPEYNEHMDMYFKAASGSVLIEIKSCDDSNIHAQVRKGVSQLFEYRYTYRELLGAEPSLLLLIEAIPPKGKRWLIDYLQTLGIAVAWKEAGTRHLVTNASIPISLDGIILPQPA